MEKRKFYLVGVMLMALLFSFCSKEDDCDPKDEESACYAGPVGNQYYTMEIDGQPWKAGGAFNMFIVEWGEPVTYEKTGEISHPVDLMGVTADGKETFLLQLYLSTEDLTNPIGTYPIITDADRIAMPGTAEAMLISKEYPEGVAFQTRTGEKGSPDAGTLTITEFEKGEPSSKQKRILRFKGTFATTMYEFDVKNGIGVTGNVKVVKDGKFNLINSFYLK